MSSSQIILQAPQQTFGTFQGVEGSIAVFEAWCDAFGLSDDEKRKAWLRCMVAPDNEVADFLTKLGDQYQTLSCDEILQLLIDERAQRVETEAESEEAERKKWTEWLEQDTADEAPNSNRSWELMQVCGLMKSEKPEFLALFFRVVIQYAGIVKKRKDPKLSAHDRRFFSNAFSALRLYPEGHDFAEELREALKDYPVAEEDEPAKERTDDEPSSNTSSAADGQRGPDEEDDQKDASGSQHDKPLKSTPKDDELDNISELEEPLSKGTTPDKSTTDVLQSTDSENREEREKPEKSPPKDKSKQAKPSDKPPADVSKKAKDKTSKSSDQSSDTVKKSSEETAKAKPVVAKDKTTSKGNGSKAADDSGPGKADGSNVSTGSAPATSDQAEQSTSDAKVDEAKSETGAKSKPKQQMPDEVRDTLQKHLEQYEAAAKRLVKDPPSPRIEAILASDRSPAKAQEDIKSPGQEKPAKAGAKQDSSTGTAATSTEPRQKEAKSKAPDAKAMPPPIKSSKNGQQPKKAPESADKSKSDAPKPGVPGSSGPAPLMPCPSCNGHILCFTTKYGAMSIPLGREMAF